MKGVRTGKYDFIAKVDITSLYPGCTRNVEYVSAQDEIIKPIDKWWQEFPNPTFGWFQHDFEGLEMTREHYK